MPGRRPKVAKKLAANASPKAEPSSIREPRSGIQAAQAALNQHAAWLAATGDPVADTVAACAAVVKASNRLVVDAALKMQAQPVADMERAARAALMGLR